MGGGIKDGVNVCSAWYSTNMYETITIRLGELDLLSTGVLSGSACLAGLLVFSREFRFYFCVKFSVTFFAAATNPERTFS